MSFSVYTYHLNTKIELQFLCLIKKEKKIRHLTDIIHKAKDLIMNFTHKTRKQLEPDLYLLFVSVNRSLANNCMLQLLISKREHAKTLKFADLIKTEWSVFVFVPFECFVDIWKFKPLIRNRNREYSVVIFCQLKSRQLTNVPVKVCHFIAINWLSCVVCFFSLHFFEL